MKSWFLLLICFLSVNTFLHAQATLSIQGTIQKSFGGAVDDGKYSLTFRLYTGESGGTPVWSETQGDIEVIGGVYSALLGAANPLTAGFNTVYYLGISVDGGQELTPRTRLTSAPYALSLIGQGNTFPSSGTVGIGTATPDANTALTVSGGSDDGKVLITAPGDKQSLLWMRSGDKLSGLLVAPNGDFSMNSARAVILNGGGGEHVYQTGNGAVRTATDNDGFVVLGRQDIRNGNGNNDPYLAIRSGNHVSYFNQFSNGSGQINFPGPANIIAGGILHLHGEGALRARTDNAGFVVHGRLHVTEFVTSTGYNIHSDARIKKDLHLSNGDSDLRTLMGLEVTDYRHVDSLTKGKETVKGFIAQQVKKVFPEAVSQSAGFLPDLLAKPVSVSVSESQATLRLDKAHGMAAGSRVRILLNKNAIDLPVLKVDDAYTFTVGEWTKENEGKDLLVYGKETPDFHTVDYDRIHTLNVSATQELARRVAQLEAENAALRQKNGQMEGQIQGLRSQVDKMESLNARLSKLESLISANANR
jgi:hypothetical protein